MSVNRPQDEAVMGQRAALRASQRAQNSLPLRVRLREVPLVAGLVYVLGMAALASWAAWPIYQAGYFFITAIGAAVLGTAIAAVSLIRRWSWFTTLLLAIGAYLLCGVPLAVPSALGGGIDYLQGVSDLVLRTVLGWKELATIALPVGTYQALLVPFFAVILATVTISLSLIWRTKRLALAAVPLMLASLLFGVIFGSSQMSPSINVFGWLFPAPRETIIGLAGFLLSLVFLSNRARSVRLAAQRRGAAAGVAVRSLGGSARKVGRKALIITVVVTAAAVAVPVAAAPLAVDQRSVLRTAIEPDLQLREFVSPLSGYRGYLTDARFDEELLSVEASDGMPEQLRLAVMSYYDGEVYRVVDPNRGAGERSTAFARMPGAALSAGSELTIDVSIAGYHEVWMPLAGNLSRVDFRGERSQALTDGFFYNEPTEAGVQLNELREGDTYRVRASTTEDTVTLADAKKPAQRTSYFDEELIPENLEKWVSAQKLGSSDGAALQELITRLRERGYLSHSLTDGGPEGHAWQRDRADTAFAPSLAGHSIGRIDMIFASLLDKQQSTGSTENAALVAAVGDDEQFAVAAALLAESLGFPARVVLGFTMDDAANGSSPAASSEAMPACQAGVCEGKNLTAWVEVQESGGSWIAVNATPQSKNPLALSEEQTRDPQNNTEILAESATEVTPPEAQPAGGGETPEEPSEEGADLTWLFALLRTVGISIVAIVLLLSPLIVMSIAKALRRSGRKKQPDATERIAGGWDEYVDTAVDFGLPSPGSRTRVELAQRYESPNGQMIAVLADEAVFGPHNPSDAESDAFWVAVDAERALLSREYGWWKRLKARLSLRSFARSLPLTGRRNG